MSSRALRRFRAWLVFLFVLALVGGGAYVAMEPEMVLDWVNQLLGETAVQEPQPTAAASGSSGSAASASRPSQKRWNSSGLRRQSGRLRRSSGSPARRRTLTLDTPRSLSRGRQVESSA